MLNFDLIKNVLIIAIGASIVTTALVQRVKEGINLKKSSNCVWVSFIISMIIGTLFSLFFSDIEIIYALWSGLFAFIGADALYKAFENKIFTKFSDINTTEVIVRSDKP